MRTRDYNPFGSFCAAVLISSYKLIGATEKVDERL